MTTVLPRSDGKGLGRRRSLYKFEWPDEKNYIEVEGKKGWGGFQTVGSSRRDKRGHKKGGSRRTEERESC